MATKHPKSVATEQLEDLLKAHALRRLAGSPAAEQHAPSRTAPKRVKAKRTIKPRKPSKPATKARTVKKKKR